MLCTIFFNATIKLFQVFTGLSSIMIVRFDIVAMTVQIMIPVLFLGVMAFMLSTIIRNGNGTAVVMIIFGLLFLVLNHTLRTSKWNVFLNPFQLPNDLSEAVWSSETLNNRIILISVTTVFLLAALFNLQKREKFM